jgi:hypothetical protein
MVMLDAAEAIVLESGAKHVTFDAAAARIGVSKGDYVTIFPLKKPS